MLRITAWMPLLALVLSVPNLPGTLQSLTVLKPGGRFVIEHVAAQRNLLRRVQMELNRFGKIGDGCNPERETGCFRKCWF